MRTRGFNTRRSLYLRNSRRCLLCVQPLTSSEDLSNSSSSTAETLTSHFNVLSKYMKWSSDPPTFTFHFERDYFPFCEPCRQSIVDRMFGLEEEIRVISMEIEKLAIKATTKILETSQTPPSSPGRRARAGISEEGNEEAHEQEQDKKIKFYRGLTQRRYGPVVALVPTVTVEPDYCSDVDFESDGWDEPEANNTAEYDESLGNDNVGPIGITESGIGSETPDDASTGDLVVPVNVTAAAAAGNTDPEPGSSSSLVSPPSSELPRQVAMQIDEETIPCPDVHLGGEESLELEVATQPNTDTRQLMDDAAQSDHIRSVYKKRSKSMSNVKERVRLPGLGNSTRTPIIPTVCIFCGSVFRSNLIESHLLTHRVKCDCLQVFPSNVHWMEHRKTCKAKMPSYCSLESPQKRGCRRPPANSSTVTNSQSSLLANNSQGRSWSIDIPMVMEPRSSSQGKAKTACLVNLENLNASASDSVSTSVAGGGEEDDANSLPALSPQLPTSSVAGYGEYAANSMPVLSPQLPKCSQESHRRASTKETTRNSQEGTARSQGSQTRPVTTTAGTTRKPPLKCLDVWRYGDFIYAEYSHEVFQCGTCPKIERSHVKIREHIQSEHCVSRISAKQRQCIKN